jgi:hypothetical protein
VCVCVYVCVQTNSYKCTVIVISAGGDTCNTQVSSFLHAASAAGMMTSEYVYIIAETNDQTLDGNVCKTLADLPYYMANVLSVG